MSGEEVPLTHGAITEIDKQLERCASDSAPYAAMARSLLKQRSLPG